MFPCVPYEITGDGKEGFFSGFFSPADDDEVVSRKDENQLSLGSIMI